MRTEQQIIKNTTVHFLGKIISLFLGLVAFSFIARYLGRVGFGQFTIIITFLQIFAILTDLGLYLVFIRLISLPGADLHKITSNIFTLRFFSSLFLLSLAPLVALFIPQYSEIVKIGIALTVIGYLFNSVVQLLTGLFQKQLDIKKVVLGEVIGRFVLIIFVFLAIWLKLGLLVILGALILEKIVNFLILNIFAKKYVTISWSFDFAFWKKVLRESWPIALSVIFTTIYFKGDTLILSLFKSSGEVGIYGAAYRVLEVLIMFPALFMGLVLPFLSSAWAKRDLVSFKRVFQKSFDFLVSIGLPLIVGTFILAKPIMILIAGPEFVDSTGPFKILVLATGLIYLGNLFCWTIIAIRKQKIMMWRYLITAGIALVVYLILIPSYSYWGAAWGTVLAELLTVLLAFRLVQQTTKILPSLKIFGKALIGSLIMGGVLLIFSGWNIILLVLLGGLVYGLILFVVKGWSWKMFKEIFYVR